MDQQQANVPVAPVVIPTSREKAKAVVKVKQKPDLRVSPRLAEATQPKGGKRAKKLITPPEDKRGRMSLISSLPEKELKAQVADLLGQLKKTIDGDEKKKIRRALRVRGHVGGLNTPKKASTK